jgi:outer membrane protein assembly factor BamB
MISMRKDYLRGIILGLAATALTACASNPLSNLPFINTNNDIEEENVAADDQRKSVLALDTGLVADAKYANAEIQLPPPYVNAAWTQPGGDADHALYHLGATLNLSRVWSTNIGAGSTKRSPLLAPPVIADGRIFAVNAKAEVTAYDVNTGKRIWRTSLTPDVSERKKFWQIGSEKAAEIGFGGGLAYDAGRVFLTSGFGFVAGLDAETGNVLWQEETAAPVRTAPTAANGHVYIVTNTNEFIAFNQETGESEWDFQSFEENARFLSSSSPAAIEEVVVAPFSSGEVAALLTENGRQIWSQTIARSSRLTALSNLNDIAGSPVIDQGVVYAISHAGQMSALDLRSGQTVWETAISGLQTPWVAGDYIFVISVDSELVCLTRESGEVVWVKQLPRHENEKKKKKRIAWAGPVIAGGNLILASSHGQLITVSPQNGEINNTRKIGKGTLIKPVVANERLFILSTDGKLTAYQ